MRLKPTTRLCPQCGTAFTSSYNTYCSDPCRKEQKRVRDRARYAADPDRFREVAKNYRAERPDVVRQQWESRYRSAKELARSKLRGRVSNGLIEKPSACQECGDASMKIQGHHHDYSKPFDVEWLCTRCHGLRHRMMDEQHD